jgi:hypothetical protein
MIGETINRHLVLSTEYLESINKFSIFITQFSILKFLEDYHDW